MDQANEKPRPDKYASGVTLRAVVLALLIIPLNNYWVFYMEIVLLAGHPTTTSLFFNAVFILVLLVSMNSLIRRVAPRWVFSQGEMLTVYIMINIASALGSHDLIQVLIPEMAFPFKYATPENQWGRLFVDKIPKWLTVRDPNAIKGFFEGNSNFYDPAILKLWLLPVLMWSLFIVTLLFVMLCMTVLLRRQWTEHEKLTYPLVQLPLDVTAEKTSFFRNKLLWLGAGMAVAFDLMQGLHVFYPSIPYVSIKDIDLRQSMTTMPWAAIGWCPVRFYPFGIGLGFLLPLDLLFSTWFFFVIWKVELVYSAWVGWAQIPKFPYVCEQSFGAYMGIAAFALWTSRRQLGGILRGAITGTKLDDGKEAVSYRTALCGAAIGTLVLMFFLRSMGMPGWLIIPFFVIYFAMSIGITRMRAELGPPAHDLHMAGPDAILPAIIGPSNLGTTSLVALSMTFWFNRAYRSHAMPIMLEGFKMGERSRMNYRRLFAAIIAAVVVGTIASFWVQLYVYYRRGAAAGTQWVPLVFASEPYNRLDGWLKGAAPPSQNVVYAILVGFGLTIGLNALRMRLPWFPLHPVGYAISSSWSMHMLWVCMLIAWLIKLFVLRYGGLRLYRSALPFFLGIVLGECVMGSIWTLIGMYLNVQTYAFWP